MMKKRNLLALSLTGVMLLSATAFGAETEMAVSEAAAREGIS